MLSTNPRQRHQQTERKPEPESCSAKRCRNSFGSPDRRKWSRRRRSATDQSMVLPAFLQRRPVGEQECAEHRADGHRIPQPAEAGRAGRKMSVREHRQDRHRAAKQHGEQIERDGAENDLVLKNETEALDQASHRDRLGGFRFMDMFDGHDQRETEQRSERVQRVNRTRPSRLPGLWRDAAPENPSYVAT